MPMPAPPRRSRRLKVKATFYAFLVNPMFFQRRWTAALKNHVEGLLRNGNKNCVNKTLSEHKEQFYFHFGETMFQLASLRST
jgi:hypothetical protein